MATVIARVLPGYRGRGFGAALYEKGLAHARVLGAGVIETCVLAANRTGCGSPRSAVSSRSSGMCSTARATSGSTLRLGPVQGVVLRGMYGEARLYNDSLNLAGTRCVLRHVRVE